MKIAYVVDDTLDKPDGVQQYVLSVGEWMRKQGHEVHYIVGQSARTDIANVHSVAWNVPVPFNGNRLTIPLWVSKRRIRQLFDAYDFDVLHVQMPYSPLMAHRVLRMAAPNVVRVGTFHILPNSRLVDYMTRCLRYVVRGSLRQLDLVYAVSDAAKQFADRAFCFSAEVLPNAIRLQPFLRAKPLPEYEKSLNVVYLNRLVPRKGPHLLLQAIDYLVHDLAYKRRFKVLVCGKGEMDEELRSYITDHQLEDYVEMLGFVPEKTKARYLASADIAIYPSTGGESFGIVLLEGMAAARGVVLAGNNPGYSCVMKPFPDQLLDPTDTAKLAARIRTYLNNPTKRRDVVRAQRKLARQYDIDEIGEKLLQAYKHALRKRRSVQ
ncbi:glycosyl transferase family 1 [Candidatus Saccharibacteria bacterium]|nr:MAG: glycosyl transferase family 1 [Candidatus Saccharibacteria bacterium]